MGKVLVIFITIVVLVILMTLNVRSQDTMQRQAECDLMKVISAACDRTSTRAYVYNLDGSLTLLCNSVGYGIPYHVTSPELKEPAKATWVRCVDPTDRQVKLVYSEASMIITPFELNADGSYLVSEEITR